MTKTNEFQLQYEIEDFDEERIVYVGNVRKGGKKPIEISRIKKTLPRTNLAFFAEEDFNKLKEIEKKILINCKYEEKDYNYLRNFLKKFLEI